MSRLGRRALLFDKLSDLRPDVHKEATVFLHYSKKQLLASIQRELTDLLNERCKETRQRCKDDLLHYGIPESFGVLESALDYTGGSEKRKEIVRYVSQAIERFEPRLTNVAVSVKKDHPDFGYVIEVAGDVMIEGSIERIFFPVSTDNSMRDAALAEDMVHNQQEELLQWPKDRYDRNVDKT